MKLSDGIRQLGFRRWYERELLAGHAHLVALVMCVLGLMMALEAWSRFDSLADRFLDGFAVVLCAGAGLLALRRYLRLLARAEAIANQADCPRCKAYGRLAWRGERALEVDVRCKGCGAEWTVYE